MVGVAVAGTGKVSVVPDLALARFAASAEADSAAAAVERVADRMNAMVAALAEAGVAEANRQTAGIQLSSWRERPGRPLRHQAAQDLLVRLRDLAAAGEVVQRVFVAGGDNAQMHGFSLLVDDPKPHLAEAREQAMADARARAEQLATLAGRPLGAVLAIAENAGEVHHGGMVADAAMMVSGMEHARSAMPIEVGEFDLHVRLSVEFAWGD